MPTQRLYRSAARVAGLFVTQVPSVLSFSMQPHEDGPSYQDRERERQRNLTRRLLTVIGALVAAIMVALLLR